MLFLASLANLPICCRWLWCWFSFGWE